MLEQHGIARAIRFGAEKRKACQNGMTASTTPIALNATKVLRASVHAG
jgi:hypothetical protein